MDTNQVFSTFDTSKKSYGKKLRKKNANINLKPARPPKENLSPEEIRAKVAKGLNKNKAKEAALSNSGKKFGDGFMKVEEGQEGETPQSDIGSNNPGDEMTQEKLKSLVSGGGFNFSDKERAVLNQILQS